MSDADAIAARRSLRRKLTFWRAASLAIIALSIITGALIMADDKGRAAFTDHVARVRIDGLITGDARTLKLIAELKEDRHVKAVILRINSPGGTTAGSEALYEGLKDLAAEKPLVAVMDTVAASGGYIAALPADRIIARGNTITGSIGVIFQMPEFSKLMELAGIHVETIKSGELKAEPSPYAPASPKARELSQAMVADGFKWFSGLVAERRKLSAANMELISDGRVFTGRQALEVGLIDALGGEKEATAWLKSAKNLPDSLEIIEHEREESELSGAFGMRILNLGLRAAGLAPLAEAIEKAFLSETLRLDGLLSLWQP